MNSLIKLTISGFSGNDYLHVNSFSYEAKMKSEYKILLECDYNGADEIEPSEILYRNATVTISDDRQERYFHGVVHSCGQSNNSNTEGKSAFCSVVIEIAAPLEFMKHNYNTRVFEPGNIITYINKVALPYRIMITPPIIPEVIQREFCMQYNETDYNFLNRLCESEGVFYYFRHTQSESIMKLGNSISDYLIDLPVKLGKGNGEIDYTIVSKNDKVMPKFNMYNDYDFNVPTKLLKSRKTAQSTNVFDNTASPDYRHLFPVGSFLMNDMKTSDISEKNAQNLHEANRAHRETMNLQINNIWQDIDVGGRLKISSTGKVYAVTKYSLHINCSESEQNISVDLTCIDVSTPYRPKQETPVPAMPIQTATVVGMAPGTLLNKKDEESEKNMLVKVKFHWDVDPTHVPQSPNCSCWIRAAQPWAGNMRGFCFLPRVGDEVFVAFDNGHPDRPQIIGSAFNGKNKMPYSLVEKNDVSGIFSRTIPDTAESSSIFFKDTAGKVELNDYTTGHRNTLAQQDISIKSNGNINIEGKTISLNAYDPESGKSSFVTLTPELISVLSELVNENTGGTPNIINAGELNAKVTPGSYYGAGAAAQALPNKKQKEMAKKAAKKAAKEEVKNEKAKVKAAKKSAELAQKGAKQGVEAAKSGDVSKITVEQDAVDAAAEMGTERLSGA